MADDPLNRARRQLLASTDQLLTQLDEAALGDSFRAISPGLGAARQKAREKAIDVVTSRARALLADKIGADLGWELLDRSRWVGPEAAAIYASRLSSVADFLTSAQAAGRDSRELTLWTRYWQHQIAGSDVHKVARAANLAISGNTPVMGRYERIAEPRACAWCRGLATRGAVYYERGTAAASGHAHCRCEVVAVTDPSMIAETRKAGAEAWDASSLSGQENPFRGSARSSPLMDPALTRQGAQTVERSVALKAQLRSYEDALNAGGGTPWMQNKVTELRAELDDLERGFPAVDAPRFGSEKVPMPTPEMERWGATYDELTNEAGWLDSMSDETKDALKRYTGKSGDTAADDLNYALRRGRLSPEQERAVELIDEAIDSADRQGIMVPRERLLYRGMQLEPDGPLIGRTEDEIRDLVADKAQTLFQVGDEIDLGRGGFVSTSTDVNPALDASLSRTSPGVVFEIAPTSGAPMQQLTYFDDEYEVLVSRKARFRILDVQRKVAFDRGDGQLSYRTVVQLERVA